MTKPQHPIGRWLWRVVHTLGLLSSTWVGAAALALALLVLGLATDGSLALAWRLVQSQGWLTRVQAQGVHGAVLRGGSIDQLTWLAPDGPTVQVQKLTVRWSLGAALQGKLNLTTLHAAAVVITPARKAQPWQRPTLTLPLPVQAQWVVDEWRWADQPNWVVKQTDGHYQFDNSLHSLQARIGQFSSGSYSLDASLSARSEQALQVQVDAHLQARTVAGVVAPALIARAQLSGALGLPAPVLKLQGDIRPATTGAAAAPRAQFDALLALSAAQPIAALHAQWQQLDLAPWWPGAPHTVLSGAARVQPEGADWLAEVNSVNARPGRIDASQWPVQQAQAKLRWRGGAWDVLSLTAQLTEGSLSARGHSQGTASWVDGSLQGVRASALHSRWPDLRLSGPLRVQRDGAVWQARGQLSGQALGAALTLDGQGRWDATQRRLQAQAQLSGAGLRLNLDGSLAAQDGLGQVQIHLDDAQSWQAWLTQNWPALGWRALGQAQASLTWQGGWDQVRDQLKLTLQAQLPTLQTGLDGTSLTLRPTQLQASGTPADWQLQAQSQWTQGAHHGQIKVRAQGSLPDADTARLSISQIDLDAELGAPTPGIALSARLDAAWAAQAQRDAQGWHLALGGGAFSVRGPRPGVARVSWRPAQIDAIHTTWQLAEPWRGELTGLPAMWAESLSPTPMAELGLQTDLMWGGAWSVATRPDLQAELVLARSSGDWRAQVGDGGAWVAAGVRDARLQVNVSGRNVAGQILWDSAQAGHAVLAFGTVLGAPGADVWPDDAPVGARLQFQLPPIAAWSVLMPPGWRLRGTTDVDLDLAGTRHEPVWTGTLRARDLALRAPVHGIDFSQGTLDAHVQGQQLIIDRFALRGAGASPANPQLGGELTLSGAVQWLTDRARRGAWSHLQLDMQARAQGLRLSSRPDRRASVSGQAHLGARDAVLTLRGDVRVDSALITLPDSSTPSLGADVRVRGRPGSAAPTGPAVTLNPLQRAGLQSDLVLTVSLGDDFAVRGKGLSTRLEGQVALQLKEQAVPSVFGTIRTRDGHFKAYGQNLDIEQGELRFTGALDNPELAVLAIRPKLSQRVGVQVDGNARSPLLRLYADPDLPDAEKLAWLLTGRSGGGLGAQAALVQQAATALLARGGSADDASLAQRFGLDELTLGERSGVHATTGEAFSATTLMLGKRLSDDFYVTIETGVNGALAVLSVFYELTQRLTLRAQTGETRAIDLITSWRYD